MILQPRQIVVRTTQVDEWVAEISFDKPLPFVTLVSDRVLYDSPIAEGMLKRHGYRAVDRDYSLLATRYVRPLPLWAICLAGSACQLGFWRSLHWGHRHGLIRLANRQGTITRLRDIRPWPLKGRRYAEVT